MNEIVKKLWVTALRNGAYRQARGRLRVGPKYSCLGVLCDLFKIETGKGHWQYNYDLDGFIFHTRDRNKPLSYKDFLGDRSACLHSPSLEIQKWAGITDVIVSIERNFIEELAYRNDYQKQNFREISKYIEQDTHWEELTDQ